MIGFTTYGDLSGAGAQVNLDCEQWISNWWIPEAACRLVVATPTAAPSLWRSYVDGAFESYRRFGVERALEYDKIRDGVGTKIFFAALDEDRTVIGGARTPGPLSAVTDAHALQEWNGEDGARDVRHLIFKRLLAGVVEIKSAWVMPDKSRSGALTAVLARTPIHAMDLLDIRFALATSADHVLAKWGTSGGVVATDIPATPYPDNRYRTKIMSWDRRNYLKKAVPAQRPSLRAELATLSMVPRIAGPGSRSLAL